MNPVEELAETIDAFVLPNRYGDSMQVAAALDALVRYRIAEALKTQPETGVEQ